MTITQSILKIGMVFALVYYQVLIKAKNNYRNNFSYAFYGLATSTVTLIIQEVVGHQGYVGQQAGGGGPHMLLGRNPHHRPHQEPGLAGEAGSHPTRGALARPSCQHG